MILERTIAGGQDRASFAADKQLATKLSQKGRDS
jgi:hypothetical protein